MAGNLKYQILIYLICLTIFIVNLIGIYHLSWFTPGTPPFAAGILLSLLMAFLEIAVPMILIAPLVYFFNQFKRYGWK